MSSKNTDYVKSLIEDKCDPTLGSSVYSHLIVKGLDTHMEEYAPEEAVRVLKAGIRDAFRYLGLDPEDPSTKDTPRRFACMMVGELTKGLNYDFFPKCTTTPNGVDRERHDIPKGGLDSLRDYDTQVGAYNQMVLVKDIQTLSLCEHHLQTIDGVTHIAYIPKTKVLGLSKFARVTDFFARRPQIQERMTEQIFEALCFILETDDVAVVQDATHFCMRARGALQANARTQTNKMGGKFMTQAALREEFLDAIRG